MQYRSKRGFTGGAQLGVLIAATGGGLMALSLVNMIAGYFLIPSGTPAELAGETMLKAIKDPANIGIARALQAASALFIFFLPALFYSSFTFGKNKIWLGFNRHTGLVQFALAIGIIILANIAASPLEDFSRNMLAHFPRVNKQALDLEKTYNDTVNILGRIRSWPELLLALLIMAFMPALFEETYFRGALQNLFQRWWKLPLAAIIVSSLIFSLVHFSIFLFLSRFILSLALAMMFYFTRNLWVSIAAHFVNNALAVFYMYYKSAGNKEVDMKELTPGYELLSALVATVLIIWFVILLNRLSAKNRVKAEENEKKDLSTGISP